MPLPAQTYAQLAPIAVQAAALLGLKLAGVDLIFGRLKNPVVLEVNSRPGVDAFAAFGDQNTQAVLNLCRDIVALIKAG